tara:strand:+ start:128 stop:640 length:513 start_codon:yes stop_codon:yes gene_type:complete
MNFSSKNLKTIWYLEMLSIDEFKPTNLIKGCKVIKLGIPLPTMNQFFYREVGRLWHWTDRKDWTLKKWIDWVERKNLQTWILLYRGTPGGYFELEITEKGVEIAYFGLLPQFLGRKLGGGFLSTAIKSAWKLNKKRIWVQTCNLDHPNAFNNYVARGFKVFCKKNEHLNI